MFMSELRPLQAGRRSFSFIILLILSPDVQSRTGAADVFGFCVSVVLLLLSGVLRRR